MNTNRRALEGYTSLEQVAGFTCYTLQDGLENGVEIIEMMSGSGLRVGVCPSRGLDVVFAELNGVNLTWRHPNGVIAPTYYNEENLGWLRGGPCGLVTTCGLESIGPDCEVEGERWGLHDRFSYLPAREVAPQTTWHSDDHCEFRLTGAVRQTRLFGSNLRVQRTLSMRLGENRLVLRDEICNDGFEPAPYSVLYHCNFGYPLLEEGAEVIVDSDVTPRTDVAAKGLETRLNVEAPTAGYQEQVFFHQLRGDEGKAALWNPKRNLGVVLNYSKEQLPHLTQWKMLGAGAYAMGLEPSNTPLAPRKQLLEQGTMPILQAGTTQEFAIQFDFVTQRPN